MRRSFCALVSLIIIMFSTFNPINITVIKRIDNSSIDRSPTCSNGFISLEEAQNAADVLIGKVTDYWSRTSSPHPQRHWKIGSLSGEPLLIHDISETRPLYYLVPVIEPKTNPDLPEEPIGLISIDVSSEEWLWYLEEYRYGSFPPITCNNARDIIIEHLLSTGVERSHHSDISRGIAVTMPNKELYWYLEIQGTDERTGYRGFVNIYNGSDIRINEYYHKKPRDDPYPKDHNLFSRGRNIPESYNISGNSLDDGGDWYHSQSSMYCGPASLQMVFDYYGPLIEQADIADAGHYDDAQGVWPSDLIRAGHFSNSSTSSGLVLGSSNKLDGYPERSLGYAGFTHDWSDGSPDYPNRFIDLKRLIAGDTPPILCMWWDESHNALHYRVPRGYNNDTGEIICYEPNLNYKGQPGKNYHFNEDTFVNDLWKIHTGGRWAMMSGPWIVNVTIPLEVDEGDPFTISTNVTYPCPYPFSGYPASEANSVLELPGSYVIGGDNLSTKELDITTAPGNDTVRWTVTAPRTMINITDTIRVTGSGNISGNVSSWWGSENYTDRIGATIELDITVVTHTPSITEVTLPFTANKRSNITAIPFGWSDPDDDPPQFTWRWLRNGTYVPGENGSTYCGEKNKGDLIRVECIPFDGKYDGEMKFAEVLVVNSPPILNYSIDVLTLDEDTPNSEVDLSEIFVDIDGDELIFTSTISENINITVFPNGTVMLEPKKDWNGNETVKFMADDGDATEETIIRIIVKSINDGPIMRHIGDQECHVGEWFNLTVEAIDHADGDYLNFSDNTPLFDIDKDTGSIYFLPQIADMGAYNVNITVDDGKGGAESEDVLFSVININHPPELISVGGKRVTDNFVLMFGALEKNLFNLSIEANDPDLTFPGKDNITFNTNITDNEGYDDLSNFIIHRKNGIISFIPSQEDVNKSKLFVNVTVEDMWGGMDFVHLEITVININDPPPSPEILFPLPGSVHENATLKLIAKTLNDMDGDVLRYCWDMDSKNGLQADAVGVDTNIVFSKSGIYTITLVVSDGTASSGATVTVDITVPRPPDPKDDVRAEDEIQSDKNRSWLSIIIIVFLLMAIGGTSLALMKKGSKKPIRNEDDPPSKGS